MIHSGRPSPIRFQVSSSPASCGSRKYSAAIEASRKAASVTRLRRVSCSAGRSSSSSRGSGAACCTGAADSVMARAGLQQPDGGRDARARAARRPARRGARPRRARGRRRGRRRSAPPGRPGRRRACRRTPSPAPRRVRPVSASRCAAVTEVAKCSEGMAARGFPPRKPYRGSSRNPRTARRTRPSCAAAPACARRPSGPRARRTTGGAVAPPSSRSVRDRTSRRCGPRRAGSGRGGAAAGTARCRGGTRTRSSATRRAAFSHPLKAAGAAERALQAQRRRLAAADELVDLHRIVDRRGARAPRGRRWASRRWRRRPTSAGRTSPRRARASAGRGRRARTGAVAAVAVTTGGGSLRRRRTSGAATPAASAVTAAARMAVEGRTAAPEHSGRAGARAAGGASADMPDQQSTPPRMSDSPPMSGSGKGLDDQFRDLADHCARRLGDHPGCAAPPLLQRRRTRTLWGRPSGRGSRGTPRAGSKGCTPATARRVDRGVGEPARRATRSEYRVLRPDGSVDHVQARAPSRPETRRGEIVRLAGFTDRRDRRQAPRGAAPPRPEDGEPRPASPAASRTRSTTC